MRAQHRASCSLFKSPSEHHLRMILVYKKIRKSIINNKNNQQNVFVTLNETRVMSLRDAY